MDYDEEIRHLHAETVAMQWVITRERTMRTPRPRAV